jgi:hypothetical protein
MTRAARRLTKKAINPNFFTDMDASFSGIDFRESINFKTKSSFCKAVKPGFQFPQTFFHVTH